MKRCCPFLVLLVLVFGATSLKAQQQRIKHVPLTAADVIDGSKTPELIPDHVAYRMVLLSMTVPIDGSATTENFNRQKHLLAATGLASANANAIEILKNFRTNYEALQQQGTINQTKGLGLIKRGMVLDAVNQLASILSSDQLTQFNAYVQKAKSYISTTESDLSVQPSEISVSTGLATAAPLNGGGGGGCTGVNTYVDWTAYGSNWAIWNFTSDNSGAGGTYGWGSTYDEGVLIFV